MGVDKTRVEQRRVEERRVSRVRRPESSNSANKRIKGLSVCHKYFQLPAVLHRFTRSAQLFFLAVFFSKKFNGFIERKSVFSTVNNLGLRLRLRIKDLSIP